ncbi:MAG: hypothetical protein EXX96DRAFT_525222 [Benjaminiella poitrasii]|nr:MAG: hypothetical protein EXX96DRAFT_525222 [Benjaminiella poitrasii]
MPTWCRYCYKENHTKYECAKSKASILCYPCFERGHRSFSCPRKVTTLVLSYKKNPVKVILAMVLSLLRNFSNLNMQLVINPLLLQSRPQTLHHLLLSRRTQITALRT